MGLDCMHRFDGTELSASFVSWIQLNLNDWHCGLNRSWAGTGYPGVVLLFAFEIDDF